MELTCSVFQLDAEIFQVERWRNGELVRRRPFDVDVLLGQGRDGGDGLAERGKRPIASAISRLMKGGHTFYQRDEPSELSLQSTAGSLNDTMPNEGAVPKDAGILSELDEFL